MAKRSLTHEQILGRPYRRAERLSRAFPDPRGRGAWSPESHRIRVFWGTLTGLLLAAVFCGFIAQLADMRRLLKEIRDQGKRPIQDPQQTPQALAAQDMEKTRSVLPRLP